MKVIEAFSDSVILCFAGFIGGAFGVWLTVWFNSPTLYGVLMMTLGFFAFVVILTILMIVYDYIKKRK